MSNNRNLTWDELAEECYELAMAGLYYSPKDDAPKCRDCKIVIRGLSKTECPLLRHRIANPRCAFIQHQFGKNAFKEDEVESLEKTMKDLKL